MFDEIPQQYQNGSDAAPNTIGTATVPYLLPQIETEANQEALVGRFEVDVRISPALTELSAGKIDAILTRHFWSQRAFSARRLNFEPPS